MRSAFPPSPAYRYLFRHSYCGSVLQISGLQCTTPICSLRGRLSLCWFGSLRSFSFTAFRRSGAAAFPLLFLFLMIPLPVVLVEKIVSVLQKGSSETCYALFRLLQVPVVRHGFVFSLPGVDIEVAEQCSGIHSALSLFYRRSACSAPSSEEFVEEDPIYTLHLSDRHIQECDPDRDYILAWHPHQFRNLFWGAHRQGGLPFWLVTFVL